jgi:DNA-binding ferritin-like protein (Dps family)
MKILDTVLGARESKREYREKMRRVKALPKDYRFMFDKIQKHMWKLAAGDGMDMLQIGYDLIELFEEGAAAGKPALEITGEDVATFCDELLRNAKTYTERWREQLNRDVMKELGKEKP